MELGPLPQIQNPSRREMCSRDLAKFISCYLPLHLPPNDLQRSLVDRHQQAVLGEGLFLNRVGRGVGTSQIICDAMLWSILYQHTRSALLVGPTQLDGMNLLGVIKSELETNLALRGDFPEICEPIVAGVRLARHSYNQTIDGIPTNIDWTPARVMLPWVPSRGATGVHLRALSISGSLKGLDHLRPDNVIVWPDLIMVDGHQTHESSRSDVLSRARIEIVARYLPLLAGTNRPATVIVSEPRGYPSAADGPNMGLWK